MLALISVGVSKGWTSRIVGIDTDYAYEVSDSVVVWSSQHTSESQSMCRPLIPHLNHHVSIYYTS